MSPLPADPLAVIRRLAADEAMRVAAQLATGADELDAVRARVAAALAGVRWHSDAAEVGRRDGEQLVRQLGQAIQDCRSAAALLRAHGAGASR